MSNYERITCIVCNFKIDFPNATLFAAYSTAQSSEACAIPRACDAMPMRPASSVIMAILNPSPGWPTKEKLCLHVHLSQ